MKQMFFPTVVNVIAKGNPVGEGTKVAFVFVCTNCGTEHPGDYRQKWGIDGLGAGLGPKPVCNQLIIGPKGAGAVCAGELVAIAGT